MFYGIKPASIRQTTHYTEHDLSFLSVASSTAEGEKQSHQNIPSGKMISADA